MRWHHDRDTLSDNRLGALPFRCGEPERYSHRIRHVRFRQTASRLYARIVNEKRHYPEHSWGWLNQFSERLFWSNPGAEIRPQYAWGTILAAAQARALGHSTVAVLEFGVAGGRGLLALQDISAEVSAKIGVKCHVYGFDTGAGLPEVTDVRDLPQLYKRGDYRMDFSELKARLRPETQLFLGNVSETIETFLATSHPRVGFVSVDLDLYTSTRDAMKLFRDAVPLTHCLPRVVCYLDDIMGVTFCDLTGERLAINEYNEAHRPRRCVSPVYGLRYRLGWPHNRVQWPDMMFWAHFLDHPQYSTYDGLTPLTQAKL